MTNSKVFNIIIKFWVTLGHNRLRKITNPTILVASSQNNQVNNPTKISTAVVVPLKTRPAQPTLVAYTIKTHTTPTTQSRIVAVPATKTHLARASQASASIWDHVRLIIQQISNTAIPRVIIIRWQKTKSKILMQAGLIILHNIKLIRSH